MEEKTKEPDFTDLGNRITNVILRAAEDQVTEANNLLASAKVLAEGIKAQIKEHADMIDNINGRLKTFGETILEAHKKFLNGK